LEARPKPEPARLPAPAGGTSPPAADPAGDAATHGRENLRPAADRIVLGPGALAAISGSKDRVVIYATEGGVKGRSRTYRAPHGMTGLSVTFHGDNVTIVANKPGAAHLANYNLKSDRWALQDLRGVTAGEVAIPDESNRPEGGLATSHLLPCIYRGAAQS